MAIPVLHIYTQHAISFGDSASSCPLIWQFRFLYILNMPPHLAIPVHHVSEKRPLIWHFRPPDATSGFRLYLLGLTLYLKPSPETLTFFEASLRGLHNMVGSWGGTDPPPIFKHSAHMMGFEETALKQACGAQTSAGRRAAPPICKQNARMMGFKTTQMRWSKLAQLAFPTLFAPISTLFLSLFSLVLCFFIWLFHLLLSFLLSFVVSFFRSVTSVPRKINKKYTCSSGFLLKQNEN